MRSGVSFQLATGKETQAGSLHHFSRFLLLERWLMPSPFPGMDLFLEDPIVFPDFHDRFNAYLSESLQPGLPEPYAESRFGWPCFSWIEWPCDELKKGMIWSHPLGVW